MQNLILKSVVLTGVIGASCFLVYQAKDGLRNITQESPDGEFVSIDPELGEAEAWVAGSESTVANEAKGPTLAGELTPLPALGEPEPTPSRLAAPSQPAETPEPVFHSVQPKLAASQPPPADSANRVPKGMPLFFTPNGDKKGADKPQGSARTPEPTLAQSTPEKSADPFALPGGRPPEQSESGDAKDPLPATPPSKEDPFAGGTMDLFANAPRGGSPKSSDNTAASPTPVDGTMPLLTGQAPAETENNPPRIGPESTGTPATPEQPSGRVALAASSESPEKSGEEGTTPLPVGNELPNLMPAPGSEVADSAASASEEADTLPTLSRPKGTPFGPSVAGSPDPSPEPANDPFALTAAPPAAETVAPSESAEPRRRQRFTSEPIGSLPPRTPTAAEPVLPRRDALASEPVLPAGNDDPFALGSTTPDSQPVEPTGMPPLPPAVAQNPEPGTVATPTPLGKEEVLPDVLPNTSSPQRPELVMPNPERIPVLPRQENPAGLGAEPIPTEVVPSGTNPFANRTEEVTPSSANENPFATRPAPTRTTLAEQPVRESMVTPAAFEDANRLASERQATEDVLPTPAGENPFASRQPIPSSVGGLNPLPTAGEPRLPNAAAAAPGRFSATSPTGPQSSMEVLPGSSPFETQANLGEPAPLPTARQNIVVTPRQESVVDPVMPAAETRRSPDDSPQPSLAYNDPFATSPQRSSQPSAPATSIPQRNPTPIATAIPEATVRPAEQPGELVGDASIDPATPTGPQSPELQIEKIAPQQAVIGEPLVYSIVIRNVGGSPAQEVTVEDRIPRGARLEGTIPQAVLSNGKLVWELGTVLPGQERKIQLKVVPIESGEIGSVAKVSFAAAVSASIRITAPKLTMSLEAPQEALVGERIVYRFVIANEGEGEAKSVILRALLPDGLKHPGGNDIEYEVGALAAGARRTVDLSLTATAVGKLTPVTLISNEGKRHAEMQSNLNVIESRIQITRTGPERRFVGRPGNYVTKISNPSSRPLKDIVIKETIPAGVELAMMPQGGQWLANQRTIVWNVDSLAPGESRDLVSQLVPAEAGSHQGTIIAADASGNQAEVATLLDAKGFSDLDVDLSAKQRVVSVGDQVSFRLKLRNDGTAAASNVRTRFEVPAGFEIVNANGPVTWETEGNAVQFASLEQLAVNGEQQFDVVLVATAAGNRKVTVTLESADYDQPVITEEPVRVIPDAP